MAQHSALQNYDETEALLLQVEQELGKVHLSTSVEPIGRFTPNPLSSNLQPTVVTSDGTSLPSLLGEELGSGGRVLDSFHQISSDMRERNLRTEKNLTDAVSPVLKERISVSPTGEGKSRRPSCACEYCGVYHSECVVKCNEPDCGRWFCNGRTITNGSHILLHLIRAKHKVVGFHPDGALGDTTLECYHCACKNVFLLGFIAMQQDGVVVIICREPCLHNNNLRDSNFDITKWQPLIENRTFLNWLVKNPEQAHRDGEAGARPTKALTARKIVELEQAWKTNSEILPEDEKPVEEVNHISPVVAGYEDAYHYQNILAPLVAMEADHDKKTKEGQRKAVTNLSWDLGLNNRLYARFVLFKEESAVGAVPGDGLRLRLGLSGDPVTARLWSTGQTGKRGGREGGNSRDEGDEPSDSSEWYCEGVVSTVNSISNELSVELKNCSNKLGPWNQNITDGFEVEFVWNPTPYTRMQAALRTFVENETSVSGYLYHKLLGHVIEEQTIKYTLPRQLRAPNLSKLNSSQIYAIIKALQSPLCLIQGPPGTGKTLTSATLVYHLARMSHGQVLVVAPSNIAADQLTGTIHRTGLKVIRVCSKSREAVSSSVEFLCLHEQIRLMKGPQCDEMHKFLALKREFGELSSADEKRLSSLRNIIERELLDAADVVCTSCIGAGDPRLKAMRFRQVLVDEATQATECETLVPIVMGAKQLVLVGDHCQLGAVVTCKPAAAAGLSQSMFERLIKIGVRPIRLEVQYRMHPALSEFPSVSFYDGCLQNGVTLAERVYPNLNFPWPDPSRPMFFYNSSSQEEISGAGTSVLNRGEAANVEKIVTYLLKAGLEPRQIGVITPYNGQRSYIVSLFQRQTAVSQSAYEDVEVASVDAFQGREKDFIIVSCVRSNRNLGIGFLKDPRRLNVALTRAKFGLILCGCARTLGQRGIDPLWCNLLNHFKKFDLLMEGPLGNLKSSNMTFSKPANRGSAPYYSSVPPERPLRSEEMVDYSRQSPAGSGGVYAAVGRGTQVPWWGGADMSWPPKSGSFGNGQGFGTSLPNTLADISNGLHESHVQAPARYFTDSKKKKGKLAAAKIGGGTPSQCV